jgi:hypothetical protein
MNRLLIQTLNVLRQLPKALVMMIVIAAPVLAMPSIQGSNGRTIEAPTQHKSGIGFVLLVSLQRA